MGDENNNKEKYNDKDNENNEYYLEATIIDGTVYLWGDTSSGSVSCCPAFTAVKLQSQQKIKQEKEKFKSWLSEYPVLSLSDFDPPRDGRVLHSGIESLRGRSEYIDYLRDYFELCEEEELYD